MSKVLRRLLPLAAAFAWRNRNQITNWYQNRKSSDDDQAPPVAADTHPPQPDAEHTNSH